MLLSFTLDRNPYITTKYCNFMKDSAKRSLRSIVLASALAFPLYNGCSRPPQEEQQFQQITSIWGNKWSCLTQETKNEMRESFLNNRYDRDLLVYSYLTPQDEQVMSKEQRIIYNEIISGKYQQKLEKYKTRLPFIDFDKRTREDNVLLSRIIPLSEYIESRNSLRENP